MQTNLRAVVASVVAVALFIVKYFVPSVSKQLDFLESPLVDLIYGILLLYAGIETTIHKPDVPPSELNGKP